MRDDRLDGGAGNDTLNTVGFTIVELRKCSPIERRHGSVPTLETMVDGTLDYREPRRQSFRAAN
jgi:hypothetical protein